MTTDSLLTLKLPEGYVFADLKLRRYAADEIDLDTDLGFIQAGVHPQGHGLCASRAH